MSAVYNPIPFTHDPEIAVNVDQAASSVKDVLCLGIKSPTFSYAAMSTYLSSNLFCM